MDFYYAPAKPIDKLPPLTWNKLNNNLSREPAPKVQQIRTDNPAPNLLSSFSNADAGTDY